MIESFQRPKEFSRLVARATKLARGLKAEQRFDDLILDIVPRRRARDAAIRLDNFGITIDLEDTYRAYAEALINPSDFARGCDAIDWWNQGGIVGWWRHTVLKRLSPRRYSEMGEWQLRGSRMRQQAVLNAVLQGKV